MPGLKYKPVCNQVHITDSKDQSHIYPKKLGKNFNEHYISAQVECHILSWGGWGPLAETYRDIDCILGRMGPLAETYRDIDCILGRMGPLAETYRDIDCILERMGPWQRPTGT
ncbi:unnamed protein product [Ranitomeya imitator]|uniref:Uncharacterized protein n=1 Tax=Ranitomeya imitator TaxID=111125 RepID=A0ABN9M1P9_9NEOB|nr:unnamed protein product [Ranitomeya imitator]